MSWQCSGSTNEQLVDNMYHHELIKSSRVRDAMRAVDRAHFVPSTGKAYQDSPQTIGWDATISAPHMHAHACEEILERVKPGATILDIGSGSGYLVAVLAHMVQPGGMVVGIEHIQGLVDLSISNLRKSPLHSKWLDTGVISIVRDDGRLGHPPSAPYDAIHVGAAASEIHQALVDQLARPGKLFIPVEAGFRDQNIWHVTKDEGGKVEKEKMYGVMYVPLTDNAHDRD